MSELSDQALELVRNVLVESIGMPAEEVVIEADLAEDLGLDSLDALEVAAALEDTIGHKLPNDMEWLRTVGDLVSAVEPYLAPAGITPVSAERVLEGAS